MLKFISKLLGGNKSEKDVAQIRPIVEKINQYFQAYQSLTNDEVYAVTGYLLYLNKLIEHDAIVNAQSLANIQMPNRKGCVLDGR